METRNAQFARRYRNAVTEGWKMNEEEGPCDWRWPGPQATNLAEIIGSSSDDPPRASAERVPVLRQARVDRHTRPRRRRLEGTESVPGDLPLDDGAGDAPRQCPASGRRPPTDMDYRHH